LFADTSSWGQALAIRTMDRAGKGARTSPRDALISDSVAKSQAGKAFGTHSSMDQIGAVAGPLLAFALVPLIGIRDLLGFLYSFAHLACNPPLLRKGETSIKAPVECF